MNAILYGNLSAELISGSGTRIERVTLRHAPTDVFRPQSPERLPKPVMLGREQQSAEALTALRAANPVGFHAACGYGKTTLLQHIIADARERGVAASYVYLRADRDRVGDLLQRLVDRLFSSDQQVKLTLTQCAQLLGQVSAVIAIDDISFGPDQISYLLDVLAGYSVVLGSAHPVLGRRGRSRDLPGLSGDAALALIADDLGRPLTSEELPATRQLTDAIDGQPLHLRQAAALVRESRHSFQALARKAASDPDVLDRLSINALAEHERRALAVLALAAGALLPADIVATIGQITYLGQCLELLHRRGLTEQRNDRFGLPICKARSYRQMLLNDLHLAASARDLASWLVAADPTSGESTSAAEAALAIMEFAAERGEWTAVVRLARAAEAILFITGRWEAWHHTLTQGLQAARATSDLAAEAFFSHQLGSLALCQDELDDAARLLRRALTLREQTGDRDGADTTRHNLQLLEPPAPPPPPPRPRASRRVARTLASIAGVLAIAAGTVTIVHAMRGDVSGSAQPVVQPSPVTTQATTPPVSVPRPQSTLPTSGPESDPLSSGPRSSSSSSASPSHSSSPTTVTLSLAPATLLPEQAGSPDNQQVTASGGRDPYQYAVTSGSPPPGLSLNPNSGIISGTPTTAGSYQFVITATDSAPSRDTGSNAYTLRITPAPAPLTLSPESGPLPDGTSPGDGGSCPAYAYPPQQVTASGGTGPYQYAVTSGSPPPGLSLNPNSGIISGTPTTAGPFKFTVTATDSSPGANTVSQTYEILVQANNCATLTALRTRGNFAL